jgi:hypothetical protein
MRKPVPLRHFRNAFLNLQPCGKDNPLIGKTLNHNCAYRGCAPVSSGRAHTKPFCNLCIPVSFLRILCFQANGAALRSGTSETFFIQSATALHLCFCLSAQIRIFEYFMVRIGRNTITTVFFYKAVSTTFSPIFLLPTCDSCFFLFWPVNHFFECLSHRLLLCCRQIRTIQKPHQPLAAEKLFKDQQRLCPPEYSSSLGLQV